MVEPAAPSISFLFRTDQGRIDRKTWARGGLRLGALLAVLTAVGFLLVPYMRHDLANMPLLDWRVIAAYVYLTLYIFALVLIAICFYNLSAKRWRDRARPAALAGLVPFFALLASAAHWLYPQMDNEVAIWSVVAIDLLFILLLIWTVVELGILPSKPAQD